MTGRHKVNVGMMTTCDEDEDEDVASEAGDGRPSRPDGSLLLKN